MREKVPDQLQIFNESARRLRWFVTPSEARMCLIEPEKVDKITPPFVPLMYEKDSRQISGSLIGIEIIFI